MQANKINDFMKKQKEVRLLAMTEIQNIAKEYQATIECLQAQLETDLHYCEDSKRKNELLEEYHREIREHTDAHTKKVSDTLNKYIEMFKKTAIE